MKGTILDFSIQESRGLISGDDGHRYSFTGSEWKPHEPPRAGMQVDFVVDGQTAASVFLITSRPESSATDLKFVRSSDEGLFAGVCAGLARKLNVGIWPLRILVLVCTVVLPFIIPFVILAYIASWVFFPCGRTRR